MVRENSTIRRRPNILQDSDYDNNNDYPYSIASVAKLPLLPEKEKHSKSSALSIDFKETIFATKKPFRLEKYDLMALAIIITISLFTHLYQIGKSKKVTWDESHFGKFGAFYINRTFYHDVHPPLAKMLVSLAQVIAGHNGTFNFKGDYPGYVNFPLIRAQIALYGVALAPNAFITCRAMGFARKTAVLGASFILFDNALTVMCRYILLDEPLLFFTSTSLMFIVLFYSSNNFTKEWYIYLFMTGISLGAVLSSKWVGLFCFGLVGFITVEDLLEKFGDVDLPTVEHFRHWGARIAALIIIPLIVYMLAFGVHFMILTKSGTGDSNMSTEFQAHLKGNSLGNQPYLVAYGAKLSIRSSLVGNGYLHSHVSKYPSGSLRQQVTCYGHDDNNGKWIIEHMDKPVNFNYTHDNEGNLRQPDFVKVDDFVRLRHENTNQYLYMDYTKSIQTTKELEASCSSYFDDNKDYYLWKVAIVADTGLVKSNKLRTVSAKFTLQNKVTQMFLKAAGKKLPSWGFSQIEVTGDKFAKSDSQIWVVEKNVHQLVPSAKLPIKKPSFLYNFWKLNLQMAKTNNALVPDRDKYNHLESDPITWPFLIFPMRMVGGWKPKDLKLYQIGNPLTWWSATLSVILFPVVLALLAISHRRSNSPKDLKYLSLFWNRGKFFFLGWFMHYFPFFLMGRVTYLHHYLPAAFFAFLNLAFMIDFFLNSGILKISNFTRNATLVFWFGMAIIGFCLFMPLTFGYAGDVKNLKHRQWLPTWNIYESYHKM